MSEEQTSAITTMNFQYPKKPWFFVLTCHLVMLGLFTSLLFDEIPQRYYFMIIAVYSLVISLIVSDWPARLAKSSRSITLETDGIRVGKRFAAWDEIKEIKPAIWPIRQGGIRIILKKQKEPFFKFAFKSEPKFLHVPAYPFVYLELIPAILVIRPDLPISPVVKRAMADPLRSIAPRKWFLAIVLAINIGLLTALLMPRFQSLISHMAIAMALSFVGSHFGFMGFKLIRTEKDTFLGFIFHSSTLVVFIAGMKTILQVEPLAESTLIIAILTASILGLVVLLIADEMTKFLKVAVLCILVGVPVGTYAYQKSQQWPARDISSLLCGDESMLAIWGNNGKNITAAWYKDNGCVIDTNTLKQLSLPVHNGKTYTIWLDERFLVREVKSTDNNDNEPAGELWVYDFAKQQEFQMPTSQKFSVGRRRPVDYTGQHLAWIDYQQNVQTLRFYNIETMAEDINAIELPKDVNLSGGKPRWIGEKEIVIFANPADANCDKKRLVLWLNLANNQRQLFTSSQSYKKWYSTTNFRYALGINEWDNERYSVVFVDIEKDKSTLLAGDNIPLEAPETSRLFHVVETKIGTYLATFEYAGCKDKLLYRVSKGMSVLGVSSTGKYVLLGFDKTFSFPIYTVIDTVTGRQHKINLPGFSGALSPRWIASMPDASPFSSDEHWLLLETFGKEKVRTTLFEIPDKW